MKKEKLAKILYDELSKNIEIVGITYYDEYCKVRMEDHGFVSEAFVYWGDQRESDFRAMAAYVAKGFNEQMLRHKRAMVCSKCGKKVREHNRVIVENTAIYLCLDCTKEIVKLMNKKPGD